MVINTVMARNRTVPIRKNSFKVPAELVIFEISFRSKARKVKADPREKTIFPKRKKTFKVLVKNVAEDSFIVLVSSSSLTAIPSSLLSSDGS